MRISQVVTTLAQLITAKWTSLDDTPSSYSGKAGIAPVVNSAEGALELAVHDHDSHMASTSKFIGLHDTPTTLTGQGGKFLKVDYPGENVVASTTPYAHHTTHENGAADEIDATNLDGTASKTLTTQGDILYEDASGLQRLAKGTAAQLLKMNAGATAPEWFTSTFAAIGFPNTEVFSGTSPTTATALDLSSVIGSNAALVLLKASTTDVTGFTCGFIKGTETGALSTHDCTCSACQCKNGDIGYAIIVADATGAVSWKCSAGAATTSIVIEVYIKI